jgi:hypothetical protein
MTVKTILIAQFAILCIALYVIVVLAWLVPTLSVLLFVEME